MIFIRILYVSLVIFFGYLLLSKFPKKIKTEMNDIIKNWAIPGWLNYIVVIIIVLPALWVRQNNFFFESLLIWFIFLFIVPFMLLSLNRDIVFKVILNVMLFITLGYGLALCFQVNNARDNICSNILNNYEIEYTTEYSTDYNGDEHENEIPHIMTGHKFWDIFLEQFFPFVFIPIIALLLIIHLKLIISIRTKYEILRQSKKFNDAK